MRKSTQYPNGFTLIELMVTIVIVAILVTIAVPSYQGFITRNTVESLQNRLAAAIVSARTEAASRNITTTLCASTNGTSCCPSTGRISCDVSTSWSSGWIVFTDKNADKTVDAADDDQVLLVYQQPGANYVVRVKSDAATPVDQMGISFSSQGFTSGGVRAFATICAPNKDVAYARGLTVERSGRVMKSTDSADTDTTHDIAFDTGSGTAATFTNITCP